MHHRIAALLTIVLSSRLWGITMAADKDKVGGNGNAGKGNDGGVPETSSDSIPATLRRIEARVYADGVLLAEVHQMLTELLTKENIAMGQREEILARVGRLETAITEMKSDQDVLLEIVNRPQVTEVLTPDDMARLEAITARAEEFAAFVPPTGPGGGGTGGDPEPEA